MIPEELTKANLSNALDGADIVYFDVRLHDTALLVAEEVISSRHNHLSAQEQNKTKYSPHYFCSIDCK
jgi:alpha-galactosidase/6-phospho-beta-glucosidase family protein